MTITVSREMAATPDAVARVMFDARQDPTWIGGARSVEILTPGPTRGGSRARRSGGFMGMRFAWTTEIVAFEPDRRMDMRFIDGPLTGGVRYEIRAAVSGSIVTIHNEGHAKFSFPGMAWMVRRSVSADLRRLAALAERKG